jgi:hypothetical protein
MGKCWRRMNMYVQTRGEKKDFIQKVIEENGRHFVVAAMIDGTNGYRSPSQAEVCIDRFLQGEDNDYSQRCVDLYEFDLVEMMFDDIVSFARVIEGGRKSAYHPQQKEMAISVQGAVIPVLDPTMGP